MVYLGVTKDPHQKLLILRALTKKMNLAEDCDLEQLSADLPDNLTGADLSSLVSEAAMEAIKRTIEMIEDTGDRDVEARVCQDDLRTALDKLKPSVREEELRNYEMIKQNLRK